MEFKEQKAIYLQIAEHLCDEILSGKYHQGDKLPSVRELAMEALPCDARFGRRHRRSGGALAGADAALQLTCM